MLPFSPAAPHWSRLVLRTVRIVDIGSAQQHGLVPVPGRDASRRLREEDPGKPSVDDKRSYYWNGPGWYAAYNEACRLMEKSGLSIEKAAPQVGWTAEDLDAAIKRGGKPPDQPLTPDDFRPRERAKRTVKQRVAGLHGVSQETQDLARRLYEVEIMTVREVAKALDEPYEKTYLILNLAKTKFRRPGRRGSSEPDDVYRASRDPIRVEAEEVKVVPAKIVTPRLSAKVVTPVKTRPAAHADVKRSADKVDVRYGSKKPDSGRVQMSEAEKALRRVLGAAAGVKPKASRGSRNVMKSASSGSRRKMSEAEKALRRVLG